MILFPAIDLKEGACVRLQQGDMARATIFNRDPAAQAQKFEEQGFQYLHIVDLDGAFAGKPMNAMAVQKILSTVKVPIQLGGGIRDLSTIESWLSLGIRRVIIGTAAVRNPVLVRNAARLFPGQIVVGLDARGGSAAVEGWSETSEIKALEIAKAFEDEGVAAIIYTDISRDGMLTGLNLDATIALAESVSIPVIASGGLGSLDDIAALREPRAEKLEGAIAGRALYDGRINAIHALILSTVSTEKEVYEAFRSLGLREIENDKRADAIFQMPDGSQVILEFKRTNKPLDRKMLRILLDQMKYFGK